MSFALKTMLSHIRLPMHVARTLLSAASALMPTLFSLAITRVEMSLVAQELKAHYTACRSACATRLPAMLFLASPLELFSTPKTRLTTICS